MLSESIASELYEMIEDAVAEPFDAAEALFALRQVFEIIVYEITQREPYLFPDSSARWSFVQIKYEIPEVFASQVDSFRRLLRYSNAEPELDELLASANALCGLVRRLSGVSAPNSLTQRCGDKFFPLPQRLTIQRIGYLRGYVLGEPQQGNDKHGHKYVRLRCRVEEPSGLGIVTVFLHDLWAKMPIWQYAQISFLNLRQITTSDSEDRTYASDRDSFVVVEPDLLINVTDVAECVQGKSATPELFLYRRFLRSGISEPMLIGTMVNDLYDDLLQNSQASFETCFEASYRRNALKIALLQLRSSDRSIDAAYIEQRLRPHFETVQSVLQSLEANPLYIEPTVLAPKYGLQGRLDALVKMPDGESALFELKSGRAPSNDAWANHAAQARCYQLMLDAFSEGQIRATTAVLYSSASPETALRYVSANTRENQRLVWLRNILAFYEYALAHQAEKVFDDLNILVNIDSSGVPRYLKNDLEFLYHILEDASDCERAYVLAFTGFIAREHWLARLGGAEPQSERNNGFADLWRREIPAKAANFSVIADCRVIGRDPHNNTITLEFPEKYRVSNFREGDIVVLYCHDVAPSQPALRQPILKGTIKEMQREQCRVVVKLRTEHVQSLEGVWAIESDLMDVNFITMYRSLTDFLAADPDKRQLLLGQISPRQPHNIVQLPEDQTFRSLTPLQRDLLQRALAAPDYFLLQGPPGTGKTNQMLRAMVYYLLKHTDENILLLAFTRRAVNEICSAIRDMDYLRLGSLDGLDASVDPEKSVDYIAQHYGADTLRERLQKARVIVSTVATCLTMPEIFEIKEFGTAIIDEASQLLEPHLAGILTMVGRFILIGDQNQLPAVVVQPPQQTRVQDPHLIAIGLTDMRVSMFERLWRRCEQHGWYWAYGMLEEQARMHPQIAAFPSQRFYEGRLRPLGLSHQSDNRPLFSADPVCPYESKLTEARIIFVPSPPPRRRTPRKHDQEAERVARLVEVIHQAYQRNYIPFDPERTLGVITPFRAQAAQIYKLLPPCLQSITIDTVERYQGSQRDIIILSLAVTNLQQMDLIQVLNETEQVDRKLNVALTRARQLLIVLGDETILKSSLLPKSQKPSHYAALVDHIRMHGLYWAQFP